MVSQLAVVVLPASKTRVISASSFTVSNGFSRNAAAPCRRNSDFVLGPAYAVMIMTGKPGSTALHHSQDGLAVDERHAEIADDEVKLLFPVGQLLDRLFPGLRRSHPGDFSRRRTFVNARHMAASSSTTRMDLWRRISIGIQSTMQMQCQINHGMGGALGREVFGAITFSRADLAARGAVPGWQSARCQFGRAPAFFWSPPKSLAATIQGCGRANRRPGWFHKALRGSKRAFADLASRQLGPAASVVHLPAPAGDATFGAVPPTLADIQMALRQIQLSMPVSEIGAVREILKDHPVHSLTDLRPGDKTAFVLMVMDATHIEVVMDLLDKRFGSVEGFHVVVLAVEATLPRLPPEEAPPAATPSRSTPAEEPA